MQRIIQFFSQRATTLFFPIALILYDFAAYLTTDLIQPGIINVVRDFNSDVSLAPASVSLYLAGGMGLQWLLGPLSDRIGRRPVLIAGALIFTLACAATLLTTSMTQFLVARFVQGTSICFIATVGYVTVQEAFGQTKAIKLMAIITSIVLVAPVIGPLSGAALMHFVHWKMLFGIIAVMGLLALCGLLLAMPETVQRGAAPFSAVSVLRDFRNVFRNPIFLTGAATLSLSYIPMMSWVAVVAGDPDRCRRDEYFAIRLGAGARIRRGNRGQYDRCAPGERPDRPRFIWRAVPIQLSGLATLLLGNLLLPHVWLWSVLGTSLYAFGIGMIFPTPVSLHAFLQQLAKRDSFGLAEHGDSDGDGSVGRSWPLAVVSRRETAVSPAGGGGRGDCGLHPGDIITARAPA
ncbi:sugar transport protein [Salmonella enterica subsp. arizonae]|uniref:Sugar transport protein n=1 Tax=Salmonella enterica subsp. arizonae TaxID=59203 RepID=A0A379TR62_SALER|nr:sugar transport protein [Salmonella enterica subsp. arizonae]